VKTILEKSKQIKLGIYKCKYRNGQTDESFYSNH